MTRPPRPRYSEPLALPGFERQTVALLPDGVFGRPRLLVDGRLPETTASGAYRLTADDGRPQEALFRRRRLGLDFPDLQIGEVRLPLARRLRPRELLWSAVPLLLLLFGIDGLTLVCALAALAINLRIFRAPAAPVMHWMVSALVTVSAFILYMIIWVIWWM